MNCLTNVIHLKNRDDNYSDRLAYYFALVRSQKRCIYRLDAIDIKKIEANKVKSHLTGSAIWRKEEVEKNRKAIWEKPQTFSRLDLFFK